jgi:hypothetical protein
MIYSSKRDPWISALAIPVCLAMIGVGIFLVVLALTRIAPPPSTVPGLILLIAGLLGLWAYFSTSCEITLTDLIVRLGSLRWRIPLKAIADVAPKKTISPDRAWGLTWSLDRLIIKYRKRSGRVAFLGLAVSPEDKDGFLQELAEATNAQDQALESSRTPGAERPC